jgi:hypothetical protein
MTTLASMTAITICRNSVNPESPNLTMMAVPLAAV